MKYTPFFIPTHIPNLDLSTKSNLVPSGIKEINENREERLKERQLEKKIEQQFSPKTPYDYFSLFYQQAGGDEDKFIFFKKLAEKESGFDYRVQNLYGAPAYGYFQFMQDGKKWNNIRDFAGVDIDTFRNDPKLQIQAAHRLADSFLKSFSKKDIARARHLGYSDSALVAGAWLAGAGGVKRFLHKGISASDKHWCPDGKRGTDVAARMKEFNGLFKSGGAITPSSVDRGRAFVSNWYKDREKQLDSNIEWIPFASAGLMKSNLQRNLNRVSATVDPSQVPEIADGRYSPILHKVFLRNDDESIAVHEFTHSSKPIAQKKSIERIKDWYGDSIYLNDRVIPDEYLDSESEIYSRVMQLRHALGVSPDHVFTKEEVDKLREDTLYRRSLIQKDGNKVRYTEYDGDGNITDNSPIEEGFNIDEMKVFDVYDNSKGFNLLDRYSTLFLLELLNKVAMDKKLPEGMAHA